MGLVPLAWEDDQDLELEILTSCMRALYNVTVLPAKSDSDIMFVYKFIRDS